ncbi:MAG TPA: hypothetical protein VHN79_14055, partial [Lacunisphaera sp.]|nr:hypothetical protein [Lacunisphaera sp.]
MPVPRRRTLRRFLKLAGLAGGWCLAIAAETTETGERSLRSVPALEETFQNNQRAWPYLGSGAAWEASIDRG